MTDTTITKTVFFKASADTVWSFLTDKNKLGQWYHPAEAGLAEGKEYALIQKQSDGTPKRLIWGRVLEMKMPYRLVQTFCVEPLGNAETTLTWMLEETHGGTMLTLKHEGIAEAAGEAALGMLCALDAGWDQHFVQYREAVHADC